MSYIISIELETQTYQNPKRRPTHPKHTTLIPDQHFTINIPEVTEVRSFATSARMWAACDHDSSDFEIQDKQLAVSRSRGAHTPDHIPQRNLSPNWQSLMQLHHKPGSVFARPVWFPTLDTDTGTVQFRPQGFISAGGKVRFARATVAPW